MSLLQVKNLRTHFTLGSALPSMLRRGGGRAILKAVDGVSFSIAKGEVLSLVGESGCGKSTTGRTLTRLERATGGSALYDGTDILKLDNAGFKPFRRHIQMIFQDPFATLNPRLTIEQTLAEPLHIHRRVRSRREAKEQVAEILGKVGLEPSMMRRHPHEFSGGQRQRIGIARVMILSPGLIIADEPVSALDVSIQAQILNLIKQLQKNSGVAMLFISHDLGVVSHISDRIAVMYMGRIVEIGPRENIFNGPAHPYTRLLLDSVPCPDTAQQTRGRRRSTDGGEPASALEPPSGCAFHPRCPLADEQCRTHSPQLRPLHDTHSAACHYAGVSVTPATGAA